ncbi:MAG: DegT/DnrJ/EryC1/StrS family aminotransferase [Deltaproteobacteria bacterium]|nr:DegT/DnrJ/EryC1/StrS family aminotransferase [Deltaproteobacteria bacterium]MBW2341455.1 DegT/DnrJ/EryC1/StrS family aminotransferase [Deltaproteobacteria bacterium]
MIPHSKVALDEEDIAAVTKVLRSGQLAQGRVVSSLEEKSASLIGVNHGIAVNSGSAALHLSLLSVGVGEGSEVIVPSYVCTALLNAIYYVRATPVLADIDPNTYNITSGKIRKVITDKTKAVIVPHMFGLPTHIDAIVSLGIPVIEDCAHSVGATVNGRKVGSFGLVSILSFYATKMLGAGEGGMVLSGDRGLIETVRDLRDYDEKEDYRVRFNYKITDIQAALVATRLNRLADSIDKRKQIASIYSHGLKKAGVRLPEEPEGKEHIYYRYVILLENPAQFMQEMLKKGIECRRPVFKPLHRYLSKPGFPASDQVWERAVSIPIYPSLTAEEAYRILDAIKTIL